MAVEQFVPELKHHVKRDVYSQITQTQVPAKYMHCTPAIDNFRPPHLDPQSRPAIIKIAHTYMLIVVMSLPDQSTIAAHTPHQCNALGRYLLDLALHIAPPGVLTSGSRNRDAYTPFCPLKLHSLSQSLSPQTWVSVPAL